MLLFSIILVAWSCKEKTEPAISEAIEKPIIEEPSSIPIYDFESLEDGYFNKEDGSTYVINFWATWCAPCVKELPYFEELNYKYADKNVEVILVSLDFPNKYESKLKPFIISKNLKSKVVALNDVDSNTWIPKVHETWSGAIPATIIFNKNKRQFYEQSFTYDELETEVNKFLK